MAACSWQQLASFLLLLLSLSNFSIQPVHVAALSFATGTEVQQASLQFDPTLGATLEEREKFQNAGGHDAVHETWSRLREFAPDPSYSTIPPPPPRLIDNAWSYVKAIFRLLFMNGPPKSPDSSDNEGAIWTSRMKKDLDTLMNAATYGDSDAIFLLAEMSFYGNFSNPRNYGEAFKRYSQLAALDGNSTAQYMLGLMHATGLGGSVPRNQAKALLHHTFAAEQGNTRSEMTLGFRYHSAIGTPRDCDKACHYYKKVADKAMTFLNSGPPGGHVMQKHAYKWADTHGGIYGEGASASSSGVNTRDNHITLENWIELLEMREAQGDYTAIFQLGQLAYEGRREYRRNVRRAQKQFMKIARAYWGKDGKINPKGPKGIDKTAGKAAAYIGRLFLRGEGVEQNFATAVTWFRRGLESGDPFCQYQIGIMYRDGFGLPKDVLKASTYFKAAAEQNFFLASSALGILFLDQGDLDTANRYFELAAANGVAEAYYYLAEMLSKGVGRDRNCNHAVVYYKVFVERVENIHSSFIEANAAYDHDDLERALIDLIMAAEQGYESAQANVAYLLDKKISVLSLPAIPAVPFITKPKQKQPTSLLNNPELALIYFTRSAQQGNTDSLVKIGDYYLSGTGTEDLLPNLDKASTCYTTAAESHQSAQSLWNLGWMHENGIAVTQDFHMAKRYYDLALEMSKDTAYLPVKLALSKLHIRSWWNGVSGGKVNSIRHDIDDETGEMKRSRTLAEWVADFLNAGREMDAQEREAMAEDMELGGDFGSDGMPGGDDDYYDDFDDGLVESLIIIGIAATLGFMVYLRQQRLLAGRRAQDQGQQQQGQGGGQPQAPGQNGGQFPAAGDPAWNDWVAGGIGH